MIPALARLDARLLRRSPLALVVVALLVATAALSVLAGLDWRDRYAGAADPMRTRVIEAQAELRAVYDGMASGSVAPTNVDTFDGNGVFTPDPRDPYVAGLYHKQMAELPPGPLLGLAVGSTELSATHHLIQGTPLYGLLRVGEPAERVNPGALAAGRLDLLAFVLVICPLALIALLFDASAREREAGLTPLLEGLRASQRDLLAARGLVRGGLVLAVALIAVVVAALLAGAVDPGRLGMWIAGVVSYLAFWTALCLAVASTGAGSVAAAALGIGVWTFLVLVAPGSIERAVRPTGLLEPRAAADPDVRAVMREWGAPDHVDARIDEVARRYWRVDFAARPACARREGPLGDYAIRRLVDEAYSADLREGDAREALFDRRLDLFGWVVPTLGVRRALEQIAGVDPARQRVFRTEVIDYHARNRDRIVEAIIACRGITRAEFDRVPVFQWREPAMTWSPLVGGLGWPLLAGAALFGFAMRRSRP
jgi:ABC-2 type transport system permease protein